MLAVAVDVVAVGVVLVDVVVETNVVSVEATGAALTGGPRCVVGSALAAPTGTEAPPQAVTRSVATTTVTIEVGLKISLNKLLPRKLLGSMSEDSHVNASEWPAPNVSALSPPVSRWV
jgi:hypothetical protein